jgi:hypothetical protein
MTGSGANIAQESNMFEAGSSEMCMTKEESLRYALS